MSKKKPEEEAAVAGAEIETPAEPFAQPSVEAPSDAAPPVDPLRPVKVINHGTSPWVGSDFAPVGPGTIGAGEAGIVTAKKAQQLFEDYGPEGMDGRGPFEIVED